MVIIYDVNKCGLHNINHSRSVCFCIQHSTRNNLFCPNVKPVGLEPTLKLDFVNDELISIGSLFNIYLSECTTNQEVDSSFFVF